MSEQEKTIEILFDPLTKENICVWMGLKTILDNIRVCSKNESMYRVILSFWPVKRK